MSVRISSCLALVIAIGSSAAAQAADTCSLKGTAGTYMVRCTGFNVISPGTNVPVDVLLLQERQKDGEITGKGTATLGVPGTDGSTTVTPTEISGTAQINSDCTGTEDLVQTFGGVNPTPAHFKFIAGIRRIDGINTDPGYVLMCTDIRID